MKISINSTKIKEVLTRGVERVYPDLISLEKKMKKGERIKLYCGYDPSGPELHIGHMITLRKLAQFQALGHEAIMLIGDFTGMIGDPGEKTSARNKLSRKEVIQNSKNYKKIAGKFLNFAGPNPVKILYNSKWADKLSFLQLIELASHFTVQQMIIRDMFQQRIKKEKPIFLHEFLYPLAQAYDSVALDVDLEVGGKDQIFNMLCGRELMKVMKNKEKFVLATKLLVDAEGKKIGKTEGNVIDINDKPEEIYGKIMSWPDSLIALGFELCTDLPIKEINEISKQMKIKKINPKTAKQRLAREIVDVCYNKEISKKVEKEFDRVFKEKELPSKIQGKKIKEKKISIVELLIKTGMAGSRAEAKRLILQRGVKINGQTEENWKKDIEIKKGLVIQVGKRRFARIS